jgi:hypothetical protein
VRQVGRVREAHEREPASVAESTDVRAEAPARGILPVIREGDPGL